MKQVRRVGAVVIALQLVVTGIPHVQDEAIAQAAEHVVVQTAVIDEDYGHLNLSQRGGRSGATERDTSLQTARMEATFSNFELNGIPYATWQTCRLTNTVDACLATLGETLRAQHPGAIGGDTLEFDVTITNTSPSAVLTSFAFQSKFSESPALASRIGDKLFAAERVAYDGPPRGLIGVKKNGTANGLYGGKIKGICINSSDDYPADLNLGDPNETLECAGGRTFDRTTNRPILQAADGSTISLGDRKVPKGLLPGESMTMRIVLDAGTDDGALQRAYSPSCDDLAEPDQTICKASVGPLVGTLANVGQLRPADRAAECLELAKGTEGEPLPGDNVLDVVNFGDVKIIRDSSGDCVPSFEPFSKNQFLTIPRRNWAFTDILDTRDTYLPGELPTVLTGATGKFSVLDMGQLRAGQLNFFEMLRGFGEFGATLDPSCAAGGSRAGSCGGAAYAPWAEFYALSGDGTLVRQEVAGTYGTASYTGGPSLTATINTGTQTSCTGRNLAVACKATDPFETPGGTNPGPTIGASARAEFSDIEVISDIKTTIANEGGQAGGDRVRFTVAITNTSPAGSGIYLTSFNLQTKQRGLTDINDLDGTSIQGRQDLRTGADGTLPVCTMPTEGKCYDEDLEIGRFPNVIGNSLLSSTFVSGYGQEFGPVVGKLEAIKKNGTFQPLMKTDFGAANFICIKSGPPSPDQDADETCYGQPGQGLAPGETQKVRLELDYGDFRGLIVRVAPGTLRDYTAAEAPFGLLALRGDFDCRDQRRLPYCHPDLNGDDWFTEPTSLADVEFVTVHQPGDAATVMDFESNFGIILAMAGFIPTAEFWQGGTQVQVKGAYLNLPGGGTTTPPDPDPDPDPPANALPNAVIATPVACLDLTCTFDGSDSSDSDGSLVSFAWTFLSGDTQVGEASGEVVPFSFADPGTFTARLLVTDDVGATDLDETTVTVSLPPPAPELTLTVSALKVKGVRAASLRWSGSDDDQIRVYRNSTVIATIADTGSYTDNIGGRGGGSATYRVCEADATGTEAIPPVCSAQVTVSW